MAKKRRDTATDDIAGHALLAAARDQARFSVQQALTGRSILVTGSTGFLAKVLVSMLLAKHPDLGRLYLIIRDRRAASAAERFRQEIVECDAFLPVHERWGDSLDAFLEEKVRVIGGDITHANFGLREQEARELSEELDLVINSAGLTNFNPNLAHALEINTLSARHMAAFLKLSEAPAKLVHVSTCFVAGNTRDPSPEILPAPDRYPRYDELEVELDVEREIEDCLRMIEHAKFLADDQERASELARRTRERLRAENIDPDDKEAWGRAFGAEKRDWIKGELSARGRERAAHWGWPNIYTYTKSLGERELARLAGDDLDFAIVRPAIVESALSFPLVGWNEGINTSAPLIYLRYKGHRYFPMDPHNALDIIPVDYVCGAMLAVGAALIEGEAEPVYHLGSSDQNPLRMERLVELTTLGARTIRAGEVHLPGWKRALANMVEGYVVPKRTFDRRSAPGVHRQLKRARALLGRVPTRALGGLGQGVRQLDRGLGSLERATGTMGKMFEIFMPFIHDNRYTFIARAIDRTASKLPAHEREFYGSPIADLDWRAYWLGAHIPGLAKYVFPNLEEKLRAEPRAPTSYADLAALFEASTKNHAERVALQHHRGGIVERYTYAEVRRKADAAAAALRAEGVSAGARVALISENRPQWAMAYFGIVRAGATAVPLDPEAEASKLARLIASCEADIVIASEKVRDRLGPALKAELERAASAAQIVGLEALLTERLPEAEPAPPAAGAEIASLIYTSGTTGSPKGVMLTHKNFTGLLRSVSQIFSKVDHRDGFLSVLPLHHTFEFTCGLLMPMARGASVTYLEEVSGEELSGALSATRVTGVIGVPALWSLLAKRLDQRLDEAPAALRWAVKQLLFANYTAREKTRINLGPALFGAVHRAFGGKIKYFISGGAPLPAELLEKFHALGFNMYEGYGLTEAAPVLTVMRPERGIKPGTVGRALPGVEIEIRGADASGVGEIVARGPNVMLGYWKDEAETARVVRQGWLHTGDLGRIDARGDLTIVGRAKDVIVTGGGKNVYPDELEEHYGQHASIAEISVVGLDDGRGGERPAALARAEGPERLAEAREWLKVAAARRPSYERLSTIRWTDEELPRTPTRKIKRLAVREELERMRAAEQQANAAGAACDELEPVWLGRAIAKLSERDASTLRESQHLADELGFDSLMYVELASIAGAHGARLSASDLAELGTIGAVRASLESAKGALVRSTPSRRAPEMYPIPNPVARLGKSLLHAAQMRSYGDFFDVEVYGRANIPHHDRNIIVAANHSSHLDMGLIKYALGPYGGSIRALAAADYFYRDKIKRTYFTEFTNLIPIDRSASMEESLAPAVGALSRGEMLLIFPEGTRSTSGKLADFKKGIGYLVATQRVAVLPIHIEGTHRAMPKGSSLPSPTSRRLKVQIGRLLGAGRLIADPSAHERPADHYQAISDRVREAIVALRDRDEIRAARRGQTAPDLGEVFGRLGAKFASAQIDSTLKYYFSLGAKDEAKWTVIVDAERCTVAQGKPAGGADCVIKTSPEIIRRMFEESYVPSFDEFMDGTIKTNNPELLMRFQSVFGL